MVLYRFNNMQTASTGGEYKYFIELGFILYRKMGRDGFSHAS